MHKIFENNLVWKIFSLFWAFILWLFVINIQNPEQSKEISNIPVEIVGLSAIEEKGYVVQDEDDLKETLVGLVVKGQRLQLDELVSNKEDLISIVLDFGPYASSLTPELTTTEKVIPFTTNLLVEGISIEEVHPSVMYVTLEKEAIVTVPIRYQVTGKQNKDYLEIEPIIKTTEIELRGPESLVNEVVHALVTVDVDDFSEDILKLDVPVTLLDIDGNEVDGIRQGFDTVEVIMPIGERKVVPFEAQFVGTVPNGYLKTNTIITPKEITIVGKAEVLEEIDVIKLEPIALNNKINSITLRIGISLPENVEYIESLDDRAVVTLEIQKENTYNFVIPVEELDLKVTGLPEDMEYEILQEGIGVTLAGTAEDLLSFDKTGVMVTLDLSALGPGEYSIPIDIQIEENLKVNNSPITLEVNLKMTEIIFDDEIEAENQNS
ncbi:MAG: hypothetical protein ATN36_02680 [Epulopiscium sp. Nele67-Bin005]|nr:MAG: hypothetical protein ATN36_02680 [Epulopiscium sp. Nele67-Bin005]